MNINIGDDILKVFSYKLLSRLLADKTTKKNILWATDAYAFLGDDYSRGKEITPVFITGASAGEALNSASSLKDDLNSVFADLSADMSSALPSDIDMTANARLTTQSGTVASGNSGFSAESFAASIVSAVKEAFADAGFGGDTVIPIYIGGSMLDEIVVTAQQRVNLRSGGR